MGRRNQILFKIAIMVALSLSLIITGCSNPAPAISPTVSLPPQNTSTAVINQVISTRAAFEMIQMNKDNPDFIILDVRTPSEVSAGHIAGAINIDFRLPEPDFRDQIGKLDRNKKYLVYCRTGARSAGAVKIMSEMGFRQLYDMAGGITEWVNAGFPTVLSSK